MGKGNVRVLVDRMARLLHDSIGCVNGHSLAPATRGLMAVRKWVGQSTRRRGDPNKNRSPVEKCAFDQAAALMKGVLGGSLRMRSLVRR